MGASSLLALQKEIAELEQRLVEKKRQLGNICREKTSPQVNKHSLPETKIALFRSIFKGREDVYATRYESRKTGKSGYRPACRNEWVGVYAKSKTKRNAMPVPFVYLNR